MANLNKIKEAMKQLDKEKKEKLANENWKKMGKELGLEELQ